MSSDSIESVRGRAPLILTRIRTALLTSAAAIAALAATLAPAQAQFTGIYAFGDSYADTGAGPGGAFRLAGTPALCLTSPASCRFTGGTNFVETLQSIYGLPTLTNYAIGGALTNNTNTLSGELGVPVPPLAGFPYELARLAYDGVRFKSTDLIALTIGGNDSSLLDNNVSNATALGMAAAARAVNGGLVVNGTFDGVAYNNVMTYGVQQLVAAGARNIAWLSAGNSKYFPDPEGGAAIGDGPRDALAQTYYRQIQLLLQPLAQSGVRFFLFNFEILQQRINDNPGMYGFASVPGGFTRCEAGNNNGQPAPANVALNVAGCFYNNGVHPTAAAMTLIGNYMANQINAPTTVAPQAGISTGLLTGFSTSVFDRLEASRRFQPYGLGSALAAMPGKAVAPKDPAERWTVFGDVNYAGGSRDQQFYSAGYDYNSAGGYLGAEYRLDSNWRIGGLFGYSQPDVKLAIQDARNRIDAFQFAGFSSYTDAHWFADGIVAYGRHDYDLERRGIIDVIRASTSADLFTVAGKGGYLFDVGKLRVGPIAGLQYTYASIKGYTETGDVLLTMMVDRQTREALTGDAGVQFRYPLQLGDGIYTPFLNLTAAHDFLGGHTVTTTLVSASLLPILTPVSVDGGTYGKVAAGVSALVATNVTATLTGTTSFARQGGNDAAVSGGVKVAF
jgi:outer membrane lipase/esterase